MQTIQGLKYLWKLPTQNISLVGELSAHYNISYPIIQSLISRGIADKESIHDYLFSSYEKDVAHPALLKDAEKAVDRIIRALKEKEKILICGDYDVDGVTSSAMMLLCLMPLGADINYFLPNRVRDGYGLSTKTIKRAAANNYKLLITVDNGISAFEPAREAKSLGIDLIITDHHQPHNEVPDAFAIVDPYQHDCHYPYKKFAGVGVTFKILSLLYEKLGLVLPDKVYELMLLGTVADVVPLTGENRYWVRYGLQQIQKKESFALSVLKENARIVKESLSSSDVGFLITPQINALGRLEDARDGVTFLVGDHQEHVVRVGKILQTLNESRKNIERSIIAQLEADIKNGIIDIEKSNVIIASHDSWQPGVIGLVASRMVGKYGKPTLLLHITKEGLAKGSCRSIPECNMFKALQSVSDILESFGGHAAAAGLSVKKERIPELQKRLNAYLAEHLTEFDFKQKISLDAEISLPEVTHKFIEDLEHLEPFGCENTQPLFYLRNATLLEPPQLLKDVHVKARLFSEGIIKPIIFFNRPDIMDFLQTIGTDSFHCAVQVVKNCWNGKTSIELQGFDVSKSI